MARPAFTVCPREKYSLFASAGRGSNAAVWRANWIGGDAESSDLGPRLVVAMSVFAAPLQLPFATVSAATPVIIRNVRIFDGEKLIDANSVTVYAGKISAVGRNLLVPAGAQVIEG